MASAGRSFSTAVTEQLQLLPLFFKVSTLIAAILVVFENMMLHMKLLFFFFTKCLISAMENMHIDEDPTIFFMLMYTYSW